jgi:hypothetical protein
MAECAAYSISLVDSSEKIFVSDEHLIFSCLVNDKQIIVDYADHSTRNWREFYPDVPYFKNQKSDYSIKSAIPLGPPMAVTHLPGIKKSSLKDYLLVREKFKYIPGQIILSKQLPYGAALERRTAVQNLLKKSFKQVDTNARVNQEEFWWSAETCLLSVCVPGATNNMVDRGQMELIGLGVCTISPTLTTEFAYNKMLIPNKHYIRCKDDYSDLIDIINNLIDNPTLCTEIGANARQFYDTVYTPEQYMNWISLNI